MTTLKQAPAGFLRYGRRYPTQGDARLVDEVRGEHIGECGHHVLAASLDRVAKSRNEREGRTREGLEQIAVAKAVAESKIRLLSHSMIETRIETIVAVALRRRRDKVLQRHVAIRQRVKISIARPTVLIRNEGITPPENGWPVKGSTGAPKRLCEKLPARSSRVGTLVMRVMPSRERVPS